MASTMKFDVTELQPISSKDSLKLSEDNNPQTLVDIVRAMASISALSETCDKAKKSLQEKLNAFPKADVDAAFAGKAWSVNGKKYRVVHKEQANMDYDMDTLSKIPEAAPYLRHVSAYDKLDQTAYNSALAAGTVDPAVSSAINVTVTESNVLKEVK